LMTVGTRRVTDVDESNIARIVCRPLGSGLPQVTAIAGDRLVSSHQREPSSDVIEAIDRLPALHAMTGITSTVRELPSMLIMMTALAAAAIESQERSVEILVLRNETIRVVNQRRLVAASTLEALMCSGENESRLPVIEGDLPFIAPEDQLELFAVMLHMTALATLFGHRRVETCALRQSQSEELMAFETAFRSDALLLAMALQAVIAPFQLGMWGAQWPGRELAEGGRSHQERAEDKRTCEDPQPSRKSCPGQGPTQPGPQPYPVAIATPM
jgi:hypothetical protein